ncbi:hypothetical protein B7494_g8456 [Chlorociboria aeruginascens]|nr:hypothetical protein B7494_g8456 [Chlorociboria aeruginascens]
MTGPAGSAYNSPGRPSGRPRGRSYDGKDAPGANISVGDTSNDVALSDSPSDSVSSLTWSPKYNHLAVGSWDSKVYIYDVTEMATGRGISHIPFDRPVLSCDFSANGEWVVGAGADNTARVIDLAANGAPAQQVALHEAPISSVRFIVAPQSNAPLVATGSWDKKVAMWDLRSAIPAAFITLPDKVYSMDVKDEMVAIATADRKINLIDLNNPTEIFLTKNTTFKHQTRVVSYFHDRPGYAVGGVEGRAAITYLDKPSADFSFMCHRETSPANKNNKDIYAVNAISVHPVYGTTISTAGSDGTFNFWDLEGRSRIRAFTSVGGSISATGFNFDGSIFAYAVSYDWHKGYAFNTPDYPIKVMLHSVRNDECTPLSMVEKARANSA